MGLRSRPGVRPTEIDPRDYSTLDITTGVNDAGAALRSAYSAAASSGKPVRLPEGTLLMNSNSGGYGLAWNAFATRPVVIKGAGGDGATTFKLTTNCRTLVGPGSGYGITTTYSGLELHDFMVDNNFVSTSGQFGVVLDWAGRANVNHFVMKGVNTKNVGGLVVSGSERRNVNFTFFASSTTGYGTDQYVVKDLVFEDCDFGYGTANGGGNYGILIQGFASSQGSAIRQSGGTDAAGNIGASILGGIAGVFLDKIYLTRCRYDSGDVVPNTTQAFSSTGYMVGGDALGELLRVTDCIAANSCDDGFETNSFYDAVHRGCVAINCPQEGFYAVNLGSMPEPERQHIKYIDCTHVRNDTLGGSLSRFAFGARYKKNSPHGHLSYINCSIIGTYNTDSTGSPVQHPSSFFDVVSDFKSLTIRNLKIGSRQNVTFTANSDSQGPTVKIRVGNVTGKGLLDIDGIYLDDTITMDRGGHTSDTFSYDAIELDMASDLTIKARNIDPRLKIKQVQTADQQSAASYGGLRLRAFNFMTGGQGGDTQYVNPDFSASFTTTSYTWDEGSYLDVAYNGTTGVGATANLSAEKSWRLLFTSGTYPGSGPFTDLSTWGKFITKSTAGLTGQKLKVTIKGLEDVSSTTLTGTGGRFAPLTDRIETYVCDDGTRSLICLDKIVAGTRTSLLGSIVGGGAGTVTAIDTTAIATALGSSSQFSDRGIQLTSRLAAATTYYLRGMIQSNVVQADLLSTAPHQVDVGGGSSIGTTGAITLGSSDTQHFGDSVQGWPNVGFIPLDGTSVVQEYTVTRRGVIRGYIEHLTFPHGREIVKNWSVFDTSADDTLLRFDNFRVGYQSKPHDSTLVDEFHSFTATQLNGIKVLPGTQTAKGNIVGQLVHPDMRDGMIVGGNSGTTQTLDVGGSPYYAKSFTLNGNCTITVKGVPAGGVIDLELTQDGTGGRSVTFVNGQGGALKGTALSLSSTASAFDIVTVWSPNGVDLRYAAAQRNLT